MTPTSYAARAERLRQHPDTLTVPLAGEERPWFLGKVTFDLAKGRGVELGDVLKSFEDVGADAGVETLAPMLDAFGRLLWLGMLPFDESLAESDVTDYLSVGDLTRLAPALLAKLGDAADEQQGKAQAAAQGAADRRKGRR